MPAPIQVSLDGDSLRKSQEKRLTHSGLVKQVNLDRSPSRYCPNLEDHAHFHCEACGHISDIAIQNPIALEAALALPAGSQVHRTEIAIRGLCPTCAPAAKAPNN